MLDFLKKIINVLILDGAGGGGVETACQPYVKFPKCSGNLSGM